VRKIEVHDQVNIQRYRFLLIEEFLEDGHLSQALEEAKARRGRLCPQVLRQRLHRGG